VSFKRKVLDTSLCEQEAQPYINAGLILIIGRRVCRRASSWIIVRSESVVVGVGGSTAAGASGRVLWWWEAGRRGERRPTAYAFVFGKLRKCYYNGS
jgi:hypothetical protein